MKMKTAFLSLSLLAATSLGLAHEGHVHGDAKAAPAKPATTTLTGEVVDLSCYMDHEGKGKEHTKCAKACLLDKRVPAGLLGDDGSVTLLVADHKHEAAFKPIPGWAAQRITATGRLVKKGGLPALLVSAAEPAK